MRRAAVHLWLGTGIGGSAFAQQPASMLDPSIETRVDQLKYYVQEPIDLRVVFSFDEEYFEKHAVQRFQRELDVPVQIVAEWLERLDGTIALEEEGASEGDLRESTLSLALNDSVVRARQGEIIFRQEVPQREHALEGHAISVSLERRVVATAPGTLVLAAPRAHFTLATRFEEDPFRGQVPLDPREITLEGKPVAVTIVPLPDEGRPPGFSGAVGKFTLAAAVDRTEVRVGESLRIEVTIQGDGNLPLFPTPRFEDLAMKDAARFHVYGAIDRKESGRRTITYEVAPLDAIVEEVPVLALTYFDPAPVARSYHWAFAPATSISVTPAPGAPSSTSPVHEAKGSVYTLLVTSIMVVVLGVLAANAVRRARRRRLEGEEQRSSAGDAAAVAAARFRARASEPEADLARDFQELLETGLPPLATKDPFHDLESRLVATGVPVELARRAVALLEEHLASRYRAPGTADPNAADRLARTLALADELERARATA